MFFLPCLVGEFNGNWFGFLPFVFVSQTTPSTKFYELKNDDGHFYIIATKCLLIVDIKQRDKPPHNQLQSTILQL